MSDPAPEGIDPDSTATHSGTGTSRESRKSGSDTRVIHLKEFDPPDDHEAPRRAPTQVGPYRILRQLGRGGMGSVYLAEPHASCPVPMGKLVAIKVLHRTDPEERRRFEREAAYLQSLRHPGIVRVLDAGEHDGRPFLVMQLIEGKRLDDLILKGPLPEREAAELTVQALEALHVAHLAGILHRDIKPGNIMLDRTGAVRILDFGLASHMHHESRLTRTGNVVGTPAYMSPEQASGARDAVSRRSDVYGMGACLYELLTAFQPFTADNSVAVLRRIIDDPLVPPSQLRPGLSRDLETVVLVAMAKDSRDRYPTAEAMAADLRRYLDGQRVRARRVSGLKLFTRACWRHRRTIAAASLAVFVALAIAGIGIARWLKAERARQAALAQTQQAEHTWEPVQGIAGAVDSPDSGLRITPHGPLGKAMQLVYLTPVSGSVRLSANAEISAPEARIELFVSDRDVGKGYRLRLDCAESGDLLALMRGDVVIKSRALGHLKRSGPGHEEPWRLSIERDDSSITVKLNDLPPLHFLDLVPIAGKDASRTYIAFQAAAAKVRSVLIEHKDGPDLPNLLYGGDILAQAGQPTLAIEQYETFLRQFPDSPLARDARLRIALCLEASGDAGGALARFLDIAQAQKDDPRWALTATFHAWSCALHLNEYERAEQLFDRVRRDYDLKTLVASIPEDTLNQLLYNYLDRADKLAPAEPQRAEKLYTTAADLAVYLNRTSAISQGRTGAGDVLVGLGRLDDARDLYFSVANDQSLPSELRLIASLKVAEAERLQDRAAQAETSYRLVTDAPGQGGDVRQWALLWLGDLYLEQGDRVHALATWKTSAEATSMPGQIMACLVAASGQIPATENRFYANDVEYFNGRMALLAGDQKRYREALRTVERMGPPYDWPTPLAKHLLSLLPPEPPPADTPAPPSPAPAPIQTPAPTPTP